MRLVRFRVERREGRLPGVDCKRVEIGGVDG